jgi:hypothetical protein
VAPVKGRHTKPRTIAVPNPGGEHQLGQPSLDVAFERPLYILRVGGETLEAWSLSELAELIDCAISAEDRIDAVYLFYSRDWPLGNSQVRSVADVLEP